MRTLLLVVIGISMAVTLLSSIGGVPEEARGTSIDGVSTVQYEQLNGNVE